MNSTSWIDGFPSSRAPHVIRPERKSETLDLRQMPVAARQSVPVARPLQGAVPEMKVTTAQDVNTAANHHESLVSSVALLALLMRGR